MEEKETKKENPVVRGIRAVTTAVLVLCLIMGAVLVVPRFLGINPYIVLSGSMEPVISTGSVAFINTKDRQAEAGDIVAFSLSAGDGQMMVTHRVVRVEDELIYTKGDANEAEDLSPVYQSQLIGTYLFHVPFLGFILGTVNKWMLAAFILLVLVINLIFSRKESRK